MNDTLVLINFFKPDTNSTCVEYICNLKEQTWCKLDD